MRLAFLAAIWMLAAGTANAHPGTVGRDGCHVCRAHCDRHGLAAGQRHCHPERLAVATGGPGDGAATGTPSPGGASPARPAGPPATVPAEEAGEVAVITRVSDGDTFQVTTASGRDKVRVLGIDCPESTHNAKCERDGRRGLEDCDTQVPKGIAAKRRAQELLDGATVALEGPSSRDVFGRRLAYIRLPDGQDYGLLMIREGRCADFGWKYPHPRSATYRTAGP